jgi:SAM-dependent methyltransferase
MQRHGLHSWAFERPIRSPFAMPRGWLGRIAGRLMRWTNDPAEILELLDVQRGDRVLEIGFGPGVLIEQLASRSPASHISGVEPSPTMRDAAARLNREAIATGRVELREGTAEATGLPDASFDRVVSVNTVAFWPDLDAGVRELARVVRPGGIAVIAWHGGEARSRIARANRLPEDKLDRIRDALEATFDTVERFERTNTVVFKAKR